MLLIEQLRTTPKEIKALPRAIKKMTLVIFIYFISWGLVIPFLPLFFHDLFGTYSATTLVSALLVIFSLVWIFPVGEFLDRYSQRRMVRFTLLLYLPIWLMLALIQYFWHAVLYQIYHSITSTLLWSSADTYNRTHSQKGKKSAAWGLYDVGKAMSLIVGAIIGGVILEYFLDIRTLFVTLPPLFVLAAFLVSRSIPRDRTKMNCKAKNALKSIEWRHLYIKEIKTFYRTPGLPKIWPYIFLVGFLLASQAVMIPLFADSLGASYLAIGLIFALFNLPILLEAPFSVLADNWSGRYLVVFGSIIAFLSLLGFGLSHNVLILLPLALLLGLSASMLVPTVSGAVGEKISTKKAGELNAVFVASQGIGGIIGMFTLGFMADIIGIQNIFFISAGVMLLSAISAWFFWEKQVMLSSDYDKSLESSAVTAQTGI